jgi:tetratricopeptide (TPR) repeat protein
MLFLLTRMIATVSAAVAVMAIWLSSGSVAPTNVALGDVLQPVLNAQSLQLRVVRDGVTSNVIVKQPGFVRWEDSPSEYRIAHGSSLWRISGDKTEAETGNERAWLGADGSVDLLGLLDIDVADRPSLDGLKPSGRTEYAGRDALVFSRRIPQGDRKLRVDLYADATTKQFLGAAARDLRALPNSLPIAELSLVALNVPVAKDAFAVAETLNVEGIGKVTDVQGIVTLRPLTSDRWTIVCREMPLQKGDWVRTSLRGAHACKLTLNSGTTITLGPGALLELQETGLARITSGELQVERAEGAKEPFTLLAHGDEQQKLETGKHLFRVTDGKLTKLTDAPLWLAGFEGATSNESIGSLIVTVDGRSEPLTVGEHKVTVDIRDQIARTTIEETFVNRTGSRLEGQFHFPLPQDASISGFGMWIGNQLVEADIVEKQRAREIFETILRENRDPGLLEWAGGNIFKARVFPIEPHSEKRIKITYTQVLPLRANRYRYSYGLRSELLQKFPLRELSVQVNVNSAIPLKSVTCPTYPCRAQSTAHSARLDFVAKEITPKNDFEVVCEIDGSQSQVVAIPHRRGDDGYLMLQLTPPAGEGNWQREVLPNGEPTDLLILCDTSGSIDGTMRKTQAEFVQAMLSSLGPKDRFNVAVCDVETTWLFPEAMTQSPETLSQVQTTLDQRPSLGWSDLDKAIASALDKAEPRAQIVYVGDGIVAGLNSDPQAFSARIKQLAASRRKVIDGKEQPMPTIHSVSVGSTYESVVLKGMAAIGGGSMRQITGDQTPAIVANELLNEILQPGLRDLSVEFKGLKVAAMYPERLPNLPAGMQQILVGRYLPEGDQQNAEVIVTGRRGNEQVRYASRISLSNAEEGNSFIPRLWARGHLDQLLLQGSSDFIRDEIIRLSEDFHIITPFTSLLVLESDKDRERFGVKKRYEMRDGERFFADGKANVKYELAQQQMKRAAAWRQGLRRQILAAYARMGRIAPEQRERGYGRRAGANAFGRDRGLYDMSGPMGGGIGGAFGGRGGENGDFDMPMAASMPRSLMSIVEDESRFSTDFGEIDSLSALGGEVQGELRKSLMESDSRAGVKLQIYDAELDIKELKAMQPALEMYDSDGIAPLGDLMAVAAKAEVGLKLDADNAPLFALDPEPEDGFYAYDGAVSRYKRSEKSAGRYYRQQPAQPSIDWLNLFPVPAAPSAFPADKAPPAWWTPEALQLVKKLDRRAAVRASEGGWELVHTSSSYNDAWRRMVAGSTRTELLAAKKWLMKESGQALPSTIDWLSDDVRGILSTAFLAGRTRPAVKEDADPSASTFLATSIDQTYREYTPSLETPAADRAILTLTYRHEPKEMVRMTIDTQKNVLLLQENLREGKLTFTGTYSDHVEAGGVWWATKIVYRDGEGRETNVSTQKVVLHSAEAYQKRMDEELAVRERSQILAYPMPKLATAQQKVTDGSASVADRLIVMAERTTKQDWTAVFQQLEAIEKADPNKPVLAWMRIAIEKQAGRNEEARQHLSAVIDSLLKDESLESLARTAYAISQLYAVSGWNEYGEVIAKVKPIYERQADKALAMHEWKRQQADVLSYTGRQPEALALRKELAAEVPGDYTQQVNFASTLFDSGRTEEAYQWLNHVLVEPKQSGARSDWSVWALRDIYSTKARFLRQQTRWDDLVKHLAAWIETKPITSDAYSEYLSALLFKNDVAGSEATARTWLEQSRVPRKLTDNERPRFDAACNFALNEIAHVSTRSVINPVWLPDLETTAVYFIAHEHHADFTHRIVDHYRFAETDAADRVRGVMRKRLVQDVATLPVNMVQSMVGSLIPRRCLMVEGPEQLKVERVSKEEWAQIAKALRTRWEQDPKLDNRRNLAATLTSIYSTQFADTEHLPFLRQRLERAEKALAARGPDKKDRPRDEQDEAEYVDTERHELYEALQIRPWTDEIEEELFSQLARFSPDAPQPFRLLDEIPRLGALIDKLLAARIAAAKAKLTDANETEKLTRPELIQKQTEIEKTAREGMAARLDKELVRHKDDVGLSAWIRMERSWLDALLEREFDRTRGECWELLGAAPQLIKPNEDRTPEQAATEASLAMLRARALAMVVYLDSKPGKPDVEIAKLLFYFDAGIALGKGNEAAWKARKLQFLVALDRVEDLERVLRDWIAAEPKNVGLRLTLGKIRAERGDVNEAITLLEEARKEAPLAAIDLALLSDLYLAVDRRVDHERMRIEKFKEIQEWQLSNMIGQFQNRLQSHGGDVDDNLLAMLEALYEKAGNPEQYLHHLRDIYTATRDFRVLRMIPDLVVGKTREREYGLLQQLDSHILWDLKEAAADELLARVKELRTQVENELAKLPIDQLEPVGGSETSILRRARELDLRALNLIEAMVERRSSEVPNQGGVHAEAALAAFRKAFDGQWQPGERPMMSRLLRNLGTIKHMKLIEEQLRELAALVEQSEPLSDERLALTADYAHVLYWNYGGEPASIKGRERALATFSTAIRERLQKENGVWPVTGDAALSGNIGMLRESRQYTTAEDLIEQLLAKAPADRRRVFEEERFGVWMHALENDGAVSLGQGEALFKALYARQLDIVRQKPDSDRAQSFSTVLRILTVGVDKGFNSAKPTLKEFAFKLFGEIVSPSMNNYSETVRETGSVVGQKLSPRHELKFLIDRMENYPVMFRYSWNDGWNYHGHRMAQLRHEIGDIGDLEPRLFKLVLDHLRLELLSREGRNWEFTRRGYQYFWGSKADDFAKVAEQVLKEQKDSPRIVAYSADYLFHGLDRKSRAIEVMFISYRRGVLDNQGLNTLADYLRIASRHGEAAPLYEILVDREPGNLGHRTNLMNAYLHSQRPQQVRETYDRIRRDFQKNALWTADAMAQVGHACLSADMAEEASVLFGDAISRRQRELGTRGMGDDSLCRWYQDQSQAFARLGKTPEAVDAASGAIVCWPRNHYRRQEALDNLKNVVQQAKDLDAYVTVVDENAKKAGQDSPIIRGTIGDAWKQREQWDKAIAQYQIAQRLQPNNRQINEAVLECFDRKKDPAGATTQLLAMVEIDRHNVDLFKKLVERTKENPALAERAATSLVESAPLEAENHQALAELRQNQNRWPEAIPEWEQVAEFRKLEPTGLIRLSAALVHEKQFDRAQRTVDQLRQKAWPSRFDPAMNELFQIEQQIRSGRDAK